MSNSILVVDDDRNILNVIQMRLEAEGYQVFKAPDSRRAVGISRSNEIDLALVDLKLQETDGIQLMLELRKGHPDLPVIILTAHGSIDSAVEAMKKGAVSYITKPFNYHELLLQIENCMEKRRLSREVHSLRQMCDAHFGFKNIIGNSESMKRVLDQVAQAAETDSNVHIEGESGTGKELIAKSLHLASARKNGPFVAINWAAIPETLLESELFGYKRGAFSGATADKKGLFVQAHNGSFFLDEISEMPITMQSKLLRVLEEREFFPLGGNQTIRVNTRIITASNRNLTEEVDRGRFREDLFYRIHVIVIQLPSLRERKEDIPLLAKHFLKKYRNEMNKDIKGFSSAALQKMLQHNWPGNVRELENTIESAVALATGDEIQTELILSRQESEDDVGIKTLKEARDDFMRSYLVQLIEFTGGNVSQAAKLAGKYRADLYEMLKKYNLDPDDFRGKS
ncbi:MAG TPA: sigma-54-dependent transcriptional regulator [Desulfobacterales bacterium]